MKDKLFDVLKNSYAPYSTYNVAACVIMYDGNTFYGVNIENSSYGATMCAERVAIYNAITAGYKKGDFKGLYLINSLNKVSYPCFMCRQVISEFFDNDIDVIIFTKENETKLKVGDLIPYPFNEDDLK